MSKKSCAIVFALVLLIFSFLFIKQNLITKSNLNAKQSLIAKQNFKNFRYEGESNTWKVMLKQFASNDLNIAINYKGLEKISGEIKFKYYLDNGYSAEGSISKTNDNNELLMTAKVPVDAFSKRQLKITEVTIRYAGESEDISLKCE